MPRAEKLWNYEMKIVGKFLSVRFPGSFDDWRQLITSSKIYIIDIGKNLSMYKNVKKSEMLT